jgi:squalene synthase HpnC
MTAATTQRGPAPLDLPSAYAVLGRSGTENFPVVSRLLPAPLREDLMALYGWARLVDELGDNYAGDRLAALDEVEHQLLACLGKPELPGSRPRQEAERPGAPGGGAPGGGAPGVHPLVRGAADLVSRRNLPVQPLLDLVQANRQDQLVDRYETFEDLTSYCALSANPVGRMVLAIFGAYTPERVAWSDSICTGLQLVEHWQDVAEDKAAGRIYLPQADMRHFGVTEEDLVPASASGSGPRRQAQGSSQACRALIAFEAARARRLLAEGAPLVRSLRGQLRFAVAGFTAGGQAALDALAAADFDIFAPTPKPTKRRLALRLLGELARARTCNGAWAG